MASVEVSCYATETIGTAGGRDLSDDEIVEGMEGSGKMLFYVFFPQHLNLVLSCTVFIMTHQLL